MADDECDREITLGRMEKGGLISPITSLKFLKNFLISGEGPFLCIYDTSSGEKLSTHHVLCNARVHGIRGECHKGSLFAAFGQKVIRILRITDEASLECLTNITSFPDLILDVHWLYGDAGESSEVAIATAHNAVWCWNWKENTRCMLAQCEEDSILYSARFFGDNFDNLLLASGTVFNQILLWKIAGLRTEDSKTQVLHRFSGHDGVIFSLNFNKTGTLITSVSDDRSIRLWKINNLVVEGPIGLAVEPALVIYGHAARVWDAQMLSEFIVSIGEDATCNVWNYDGELVKKFTGHTGRSIWSIAINDSEHVVATGGGDGSIRLWSLLDLDDDKMLFNEAILPGSEQGNRVKKGGRKADSPRSVALVNNGELLVITTEGCVYKYCWRRAVETSDEQGVSRDKHDDSHWVEAEPWTLLRHDVNYSSYSLMAVSRDKHDDSHWVEAEPWTLLRHDVNYSSYSLMAVSRDKHDDSHWVEAEPWTLLRHDVNYSSYSLMAVSRDRCLVAFGNLQGNIKIQDSGLSWDATEIKPYSSKVLSLLWSQHKSPYNLFSCGPEGKTIWWRIYPDIESKTVHVQAHRVFCIPHSKQRWASAVEIIPRSYIQSDGREEGQEEISDCEECLVVLGDRKGSVHLFDSKGADRAEELTAVHTLPGLHGHIGVTQLSTFRGQLYSAGRDGTYRQYKLHESRLELIDTKKVFKGVEWVEKMLFTTDGDIIIAAFHTAYFILWSVERNEPLFKVKCGGGHRAWDLSLQQIPGSRNTEAVFTFLKGNHINTHSVLLRNSVRIPVLKSSFHGREATCLRYVGKTTSSHPGHERHVFVTGSEDTNINLMTHDSTSGCLTKVFTAQGHISSVRALSVSECSSDIQSPANRYLLFSGGGRASLKCWRIDLSAVNTEDDRCRGDSVSSSPVTFLSEYSSRLSSYKRRRRKHGEHLYSEIRFMSLTSFRLCDVIHSKELIGRCQSLYGIAAACSDGFVRVFGFDEEESKFSLLAQSVYLQRCVLTTRHVLHHDSHGTAHVLVFAGDTAGRISVWDATVHVMDYVREVIDDDNNAYDDDGGGDDTREMETEHRVEPTTRASSSDFMQVGGSGLTSEEQSLILDTLYNEKQHDSESLGHKWIRKETDQDSIPSNSHILPGHERESVIRTSQCSLDSEKRKTDYPEENVERGKYSCMRLVQASLGSPVHVFAAHQSGVNDISIVKGCTYYNLCSGGDDSALYVAHFTVHLDDGESRAIHVIEDTSVPSAHTSSVTGTAFLDESHVASVSVDQRLKVWELTSSNEGEGCDEGTVQERLVTFVDVPDVQDIEAWETGRGNVAIGVCGVGLQMFHLSHNTQKT